MDPTYFVFYCNFLQFFVKISWRAPVLTSPPPTLSPYKNEGSSIKSSLPLIAGIFLFGQWRKYLSFLSRVFKLANVWKEKKTCKYGKEWNGSYLFLVWTLIYCPCWLVSIQNIESATTQQLRRILEKKIIIEGCEGRSKIFLQSFSPQTFSENTWKMTFFSFINQKKRFLQTRW